MKCYGPKCDMWSLGGITYCLLSGFPPFNGASDLLITEKVKKGEYSFGTKIWNSVSDKAKDFIRKLLEKDVDKRLSADQALKHPWIVNAVEGEISPRRQNRICREYVLWEEIKELLKEMPKHEDKKLNDDKKDNKENKENKEMK